MGFYSLAQIYRNIGCDWEIQSYMKMFHPILDLLVSYILILDNASKTNNTSKQRGNGQILHHMIIYEISI